MCLSLFTPHCTCRHTGVCVWLFGKRPKLPNDMRMILVEKRIASDFMFHTKKMWFINLTAFVKNSAPLWPFKPAFGHKWTSMHRLNIKSILRAACWLSISSSMQTNIHSQWKPWWWGCIYTAVEDSQNPSGHQGDHRWFPCKTPLSDQWIYVPECPPLSNL